MGDKLDAKKAQIKSTYGLEFIDFMKMWWDQEKSCRICKCGIIPMKSECYPNTETACIDHDHNTGKVLGLLCSNCNTAIGKLLEDRGIIDNASQYIEDTGKTSKKKVVEPELIIDKPPKIETQENLNTGLFKLINS